MCRGPPIAMSSTTTRCVDNMSKRGEQSRGEWGETPTAPNEEAMLDLSFSRRNIYYYFSEWVGREFIH